MSLNSTPQPTTGRAYISNISFWCRKKGGYKFVHFDVLNSKRQECRLNKTIYWIYIYYYTPLPLNLANNNNNKQARHHSVLATAPSQRLGLDSTLAILEPRWRPCQIQVWSQKLTGGGPGRWRQVGRCPPKSAQFWARNSHFSPKTTLKPGQNAQTKGNGGYTPRAVSLPRVKEPSSALHLQDMSEKRPQKAPKSPKNCAMCTSTPKPRTGRVATWLKNEFRGHLVHPQPPTFCGFRASESPNETRRPPYQWSLGAAGGPASPRTVGPTVGPPGSPGRKKSFFPKLFLDHLGCSNKCF